jgi:hypothetical protein
VFILGGENSKNFELPQVAVVYILWTVLIYASKSFMNINEYDAGDVSVTNSAACGKFSACAVIKNTRL